MITSKQRAFLRSLANKLDATVQVGKGGINENMQKLVEDILEKKELVKVHVLENAFSDTRDVCRELATLVGAEEVQVIGSKFVLYKESRENKRIDINKLTVKKDEPKKPQRVLSTEPKKNAQNNAPSTEGMTKSMSVIMPIFTLWITWTLPMAMGVYWIASNVFGIIQTALLNNFYANKFSEEIEIYDSEKKARQSEIHPNKKKRRN